MAFTYNGFIKNSIDEIISRIASNYIDALPNLSLDPSNPQYQWLKILALEELYIQNLIEQGIANMTVMAASGVFLDYHAIEAGLFRKEGTYGVGNVQCTQIANEYTVLVGSTFSTVGNLEFTTYAERSFNKSIQNTRGNGYIDTIPTQYSGVGISGIYQDASFVTEITGAAYSYADDTITWNDIGTGLVAAGSNYYLWASGIMGVSVPVKSSVLGLNGNTAASTITNNTHILPILSVNNNIAITNGTEIESDEDLRFRLLEAKRKTFTLGKINDMVLQTEGVKESRTYQDLGVDLTTVSDWNDVTDLTGQTTSILGTGVYGFSFAPSQYIGTLQGITMRAMATGLATNLDVFISIHGSGLFATGTDDYLASYTLDRGALVNAADNVFQDMFIPIKYNGLDFTKTYRVYIYSKTAGTETAHWEFCMTGDAEDGNYREDSFSGNESLGITGFIYKTHYGKPGYTVSVVPEDGTLFTSIQGTITGMLDFVDGGGYSPVCIESTVQEATKTYLGLSITIFPEDDFTFADVSARLQTDVDTYLKSLHPGDDVLYSQIEKVILNIVGLKKERLLEINHNGGTWVTRLLETDIHIDDSEYVVLDTGGLYGSVSIIEG